MSNLGPQFHGTNDAVGAKWSQAEWVHVGTKRSALSRVDPLKWEPDDYEQADELSAGKSRVWQASIKGSARIGPAVSDDEVNSMRPGKGGFDVHPYRNEYEDPGSTSYLVRSSALERIRPVGRTPQLLRRERDYPHDELENLLHGNKA